MFVAVLLAALPSSSATAETSVTLTFRGPQREPVRIERAQLLLTAWGVSEEYDLPVPGNVLRLDLEASRPEWAERFNDTTGYLYIEATGYAPLISEAFRWPSRDRAAVVAFRDGRTVTVPLGVDAQLDVPLRRPLARRIRLVDGATRPVAGAEVQIAVNWNAPNHCGFLNGMDVLARRVTSGAGILDVDSGKPVSAAVLWADMGLGVCGAGYGPLATADARGHIEVDDFYPDKWRSFWLCSGGKQVWVMPYDGELPAKIEVSVSPSAEPNAFADLCGK